MWFGLEIHVRKFILKTVNKFTSYFLQYVSYKYIYITVIYDTFWTEKQ